MDYTNISEGGITSCLPDSTISFNPSEPESVDAILSEFGPEGAYEIAQVLLKAVDADINAFEQEERYG